MLACGSFHELHDYIKKQDNLEKHVENTFFLKVQLNFFNYHCSVTEYRISSIQISNAINNLRTFINVLFMTETSIIIIKKTRHCYSITLFYIYQKCLFSV